MMGYTTPPANQKKSLKFSYQEINKAHNHAPTPVPAMAIPIAVARYLEKWVEMLESDG